MVAGAQSEVQKLREQIDRDGDGTITRQEFLHFYREREGELFSAYLTLCEYTEKTARLTAASLRKGLEALGMKASDEEVREFVRKVRLVWVRKEGETEGVRE